MKKHKFIRILCRTVFAVAVILLLSVGGLVLYASGHLNYEIDDRLFSEAEGDSTITLVGMTEDGTMGVTETICLSEYKKICKTYDEIPDTVKYAFLCAEDRKFFSHKGVDVGRTAYAAVNSVLKRKPRFGASTITQQVIKNISGDSEITWQRKLNEILRAIRLEKNYSKEKILEVYLNVIPLSHGAIGVGSGAELYFGKDVEELTFAEAATLAAITNAPSKYDPYSHPEECLEKRNTVLFAMKECGVLTEEEYLTETEKLLGTVKLAETDEAVMSWFAEKVLKDVASDYAKKYGITEPAAYALLATGGYTIETTENKIISDIVEKELENRRNLPAETENGLFFSMVVTDPGTGELLALCGKSGEKTANRVSDFSSLPRTPGSTLKPLALYAPLIEERKITAATVFDDVPVEVINGSAYPENSPPLYMGLCTVAEGLRLSKNTVAIRLYHLRGKENIYRTLTEDFGFSTLVRKKNDNGKILSDLAPSPLALGQLTYGISLYDMTEAYSVFAGDGVLSETYCYRKVTDQNGKTVLEKKPSSHRVFSHETARVMCQLLRGTVDAGTAKSITLKKRVSVAGKTGTSGQSYEKWFIGFTPEICCGILCGYENGNKSVTKLSRDHLSIWDSVMNRIYETGIYEKRTFPTSGLVRAVYCKDSGEIPTSDCLNDPRGNRIATSWFIPGTEPSGECQTHVSVLYDEVCGGVARKDCPEENLTKISLLRLPERDLPEGISVSDEEYRYIDGIEDGIFDEISRFEDELVPLLPPEETEPA